MTRNPLPAVVRSGRVIMVILANTLLLFVAVNAFCFLVLFVKDWAMSPYGPPVDEASLAFVYPELSASERDALGLETRERPLLYEPFTQFRERPYTGTYVNVHRAGFRITKNQGPWPPTDVALNVFLFGGSTTFGYGVQDEETIASHLQDALTLTLARDVRVYNFGRGNFYSTQERILFEQLLMAEYIPDVALFVDGMNDFFYFDLNAPAITSRLRQMVDTPVATRYLHESLGYLSTLPVVRAGRGVLRRLGYDFRPDPGITRFDDPVVLDRVIDRYLANKTLIEGAAAAFGVRPIFVWQPVPNFHYDLTYHPFIGDLGRHQYAAAGYQHMVDRFPDPRVLGEHFLWCADLQEGVREPLYVDQLHYSGNFSRVLAQTIVELLRERELLPGSDLLGARGPYRGEPGD